MTFQPGHTFSPGRRPGSRNKRTAEIFHRLESRGDLDPADLLSSIVTNNQEPIRSAVTGWAEHFFEALTEFPGPDAFFGQGPQPPFGARLSAPKICSLKPHGGAHTWGRCLQAQHSRPWPSFDGDARGV